MNAEPQSAQNSQTVRARTRALLGRAAGSLRAKFPAPQVKRVLKVAVAPLLMTTALTSDVVQQPETPTAVWSHGSYSNAFANSRGVSFGHHNDTATPDTIAPPPMTCYRPQAEERRFTLNSSAWRGFFELSTGRTYSRALHQSARELELSICETSDETLVRNYDAQNRLAGISKDGNLPLNIREAAHGIVHALMQQHNLSTPSADEALFSRLNRHLTAEAIALTSEYVVAAELEAAGDAALMRTLESENHPALRHFKTAFGVAHQRHNGDLRKSVDDAAAATITFLLRQREFIEANSDIVLRSYLAELDVAGVRPRSSSDFDGEDLERMGRIGRRSFSGEARLLNAEELAVVAPDVARIVEVMQRMHAQRNQYRAPRLLIADNPYRNITSTAVQAQVNNSGGIYTVRQAFERARYSTTYSYSGREWQLGETFRYGMQSDYTLAQTPQSVRPMWEQLNRLRVQSPSIGPAMIEHAARANIVMCYGHLSPNLLGQWQPDNGIIVMAHSRRDNTASNTRTIAHELLHLMQNASGIGGFTDRYSIDDMQTSSLVREAAASTISILIAMEFKLSGDDSLWSFGGEQGYADRMLQVYTDTRKGGASHTESLEAAGLEGYQLMFNRQWWLDTYNNGVTSNMLERIASGWFKSPATTRYPLENVQKAGRVSDTFNFTRNLTEAPTDQMRFGTNNDMRALFAYLHLQQLRKNHGERHESVTAQRQLMRDNNNPYIDLSFDELVSHYNAHQGHKAVVEIANYLTGRAPRPEAMPEPTRTPPPAPRVPTCSAP